MQVNDIKYFDDTCSWRVRQIDADNYSIVSVPVEGHEITLFENLGFYKADSIIRLRNGFVTQLEGLLRQ